MKVVEVSRDLVNSIDLNPLMKYIDWHENSKFFNLEAGKEHYRLLAYLAEQIDSDLLIDIGTFYGFSAMALSRSNKQVITYDVCDWIPDNLENSVKNKENVVCKITDCTNDMDTVTKSTFVVLDIDPHDGKGEREIIQSLKMNNFKGVLFLDDINLNKDMKDFWNEIELPKFDLTSYGHWSGSGIVLFTDEYEFVLS